jgi:(p)ppGpp synthase/HD superfamily hydrolase
MAFIDLRNEAHQIYLKANNLYDSKDYFVHIEMVEDLLIKHKKIFKLESDYNNTIIASWFHDVIEDCSTSYEDILEISNNDAAAIVLAVTDVPAENRLVKHLLTMIKTVKDYRAIVLKLCDILANTVYSKEHCNKMYFRYVKEYEYRRPIFTKALSFYKTNLNQENLNKLLLELDEINQF